MPAMAKMMIAKLCGVILTVKFKKRVDAKFKNQKKRLIFPFYTGKHSHSSHKGRGGTEGSKTGTATGTNTEIC